MTEGVKVKSCVYTEAVQVRQVCIGVSVYKKQEVTMVDGNDVELYVDVSSANIWFM